MLRNVFIIVGTVTLTACSTFSFTQSSSTQPTTPAQTNDTVAQTAGLVGTTVNEKTGDEQNIAVNMTGGGSIAAPSMNDSDKAQMAHALDSPLGKSVQWTNGGTGYSYTVTPVRKVVINQNPFCREYGLVIVKDGNREAVRATACVTTDGNWHRVSENNTQNTNKMLGYLLTKQIQVTMPA